METIKFSPIGKQDLRIGNGKFEVTLADGSTVLLDDVDIGYLSGDSFTEANLPPPTGSGKLARVTNNARGLWMDGPNSAWYQLTNETVNVLNFSSFSAAVTDIGSAVRTLVIPRSMAVTGAVSVPSTITLMFVNTGDLNISGGVTVTIAGPILSAPRQIFAVSGLVSINHGRIDPVRPEWWGAKADNTTDDTGSVQAASTALANGGVIFVGQRTVWTPANVDRKSVV